MVQKNQGTTMKKKTTAQVFSVIAIFVGLLVSYTTPEHNGEAIWTLVGTFLGHAMRDLFGSDDGPVVNQSLTTAGPETPPAA
jgi:hypothetical protein